MVSRQHDPATERPESSRIQFAHAKQAERKRLHSPTIMVVDDEEAICRVYKEMLERAGYTIIVAKNGRDALELFQSDPDAVDLIITDIEMPEMNGDQFINEVLHLRPEMPFIICSGYCDRNADHVHQAPGARKVFLHKPCSLSELTGTVREQLSIGN